MKKLFTFALFITAVAILSTGNIPVQAQSLQITSNDNPQVVNDDCSVSYSGGSSNNDTTNPDENATLPGGTISYQGGTHKFNTAGMDQWQRYEMRCNVPVG